jgi:hypothetical protein
VISFQARTRHSLSQPGSGISRAIRLVLSGLSGGQTERGSIGELGAERLERAISNCTPWRPCQLCVHDEPVGAEGRRPSVHDGVEDHRAVASGPSRHSAEGSETGRERAAARVRAGPPGRGDLHARWDTGVRAHEAMGRSPPRPPTGPALGQLVESRTDRPSVAGGLHEIAKHLEDDIARVDANRVLYTNLERTSSASSDWDPSTTSISIVLRADTTSTISGRVVVRGVHQVAQLNSLLGNGRART